MLIFSLFGYFALILESGTQEISSVNSQTLKDDRRNNDDVDWDTPGQSFGINAQDGALRTSNGVQNQVLDQQFRYSNEWRPVIRPVRLYSYADGNIRQEDNSETNEHQPNPYASKPAVSDVNESFPIIYSVGARNQDQFQQPEMYLNPSRQFESLYVPQSAPINPAALYPPAVSIDVRRRYTNNAMKQNNSSDSSAKNSEPLTSSYEERYSQFIPPLPFTGMPRIANRESPYGYTRYPRQFYQGTSSAFVPPYSMLPPQAQGSLPPINRGNEGISHYDRELGLDSEPVSQDVSNIERPVAARDISDIYNVPFRVPNSFISPNPLPAGFERFPFGWPARFNPALVNRAQSANRQLELFGIGRGSYGVPHTAPNGFVPPYLLHPSTERFPIQWPIPILPPVIPNQVLPREVPPNPSVVPGDSNFSDIVPDVEVSSTPVRVEDRGLPLSSGVEGVLSKIVVPAAAPGQDNIHVVAEDVDRDEKPSEARVPYEFGFDMTDGKGTDQHRIEASDAFGVVRGSYGYRDNFNVYRLVNYVADKNGFRAFVKSNEPGVASSGSADVMVEAEQPPPHAVAEATKFANEEAIIVPDGTPDLIAEGSE